MRLDERLRFWSFVLLGDEDICWWWTGHRATQGYGRFWRGSGRTIAAHRIAYELYRGPIPRTLTIDHRCHTVECREGVECAHRRCVNPAHLEAVTMRENLMRGNSSAAVNAAKTHCIHGHPFDEANTYLYRGERICRTCQKAAMRRYEALHREQRNAAMARKRAERKRALVAGGP